MRHRRFGPVSHSFSYSLFLMYLDLDELPTLFDGRWLWSARRSAVARFRREDHLGDAGIPLDQAVRDLVERRTGQRPRGPIGLLTHLRYFGYVFNPVSFYYCFEAGRERVETIVAEINNTPWGEQHCYVLGPGLNQGQGERKRYRFRKDFHISPFMDMDLDYDWRFSAPGAALTTHMENYERGVKLFDVTMRLQRRPVTGPALAGVLLRYPLMTARVIAAIYTQAALLKLKGAPFFAHPKYRRADCEASRT